MPRLDAHAGSGSGGGKHMIEYQTAIVRLVGRTREDEEALTDLLNERARMGWFFHAMTALHRGKLVVVFRREA
jgi:hypothetical protein